MSDLQKKLDDALAKIEDLQDQVGDQELSLENCHEEISGLNAELEHIMESGPEVADIVGMPSLERDAFLADLCRECALLGIEWPADPKAVTQRLTKADK